MINIKKEDLIKLINLGFSQREIGIELGASKATINKKLKIYGLCTFYTKIINKGLPKCLKCGEEDHSKFYKRQKKYCKKCLCAAQKKSNNDKKRKLIEYKDGKCIKCGYNKCDQALTFHHRDPKKKEFGIANHMRYTLKALKKEVDKCDLLCANCHYEVHYYNGV